MCFYLCSLYFLWLMEVTFFSQKPEDRVVLLEAPFALVGWSSGHWNLTVDFCELQIRSCRKKGRVIAFCGRKCSWELQRRLSPSLFRWKAVSVYVVWSRMSAEVGIFLLWAVFTWSDNIICPYCFIFRYQWMQNGPQPLYSWKMQKYHW